MVRVTDDDEIRTEDILEYKDQVRSHSNDSQFIQSHSEDMVIPSHNQNEEGKGQAINIAVPPNDDIVHDHHESQSLPMAQAVPVQQSLISKRNGTSEGDTSVQRDDTLLILKVSRSTCIWIIVVIALLGAVIGGFCGAGKCGNNSSSSSVVDKSSNNNDLAAPIASPTSSMNTPTIKPLTSPISSGTTPIVDTSNISSFLQSISLLSTDTDELLIEAEREAIDWILLTEQDTMYNISDPLIRFRLQQRFALSNLFFSTNGTGWNNSTGWIPQLNDGFEGSDECTGFGIYCEPITLSDIVNKEKDSRQSITLETTVWAVSSIGLYGNSLQGMISPNICLLHKLSYFDVSVNMLSGTVPSSFSQCTNMIEISLNDNALSGSIPSEIGTKWSNLEHFVIYNNPMMFGTLPSTMGAWTNAHLIDVGYMGLTGTLPESVLSQWSNIVHFYANSNAINGTLPESIGTQWSNIEAFYISNNQLSGPLPTTIGLWSNIKEFAIDANLFTGTIPSTISKWVNLKIANFQVNSFTGSVPIEICNASEFRALYVDEESVSCDCCSNSSLTLEPTPSPPFALDVETYIKSVAISGGNSSSPTMEAELAAIDWLIFNNEVVQLYPYDPVSQFRFRQRYALLTLYFSTSNDTSMWYNNSGWLDEPDECLWYGIECTFVEPEAGLGNQSVVESINLQANGLRGQLSPDLALLSKLTYITLPDNFLSGTLPTELGQCECLLDVNIANNTFSGTLPEEFGMVWKTLSSFIAWQNQFSGPIPTSYGMWSQLTSFDFDDNGLTGTIPDVICNWIYIQYFYVAYNYLSGTIPECFGNVTSDMVQFGVEENQLSGTFSSSFGASWLGLETFNIYKNRFSGTIPASISNWPKVQSIQIHENPNISGTIPMKLCNISSLINLQADADTVSCACCTCCGY